VPTLFKKVVIPVAGLGTRLLSVTKEQPKEMLPIFAVAEDGGICLKPLVQQVFEQLFDLGLREFCFVVGKGKRAIEDHFTPDHDYVHGLNSRGKNSQALHLDSFYDRIESSAIVWLNQPKPRGFGDAVLQAKHVIGEEPFLVHAGDTLIKSRTESIHARLAETYASTRPAVMLVLQEVEDPRQYGVAEVREASDGGLLVRKVVEKPDRPRTRLAIMPLYVMNRTIFEALDATPPGRGREIQLTDAIQRLIDTGQEVRAIRLREDDIRLDIGTPETYWQALELSHRHALSKGC
jgi:UTP--glucose-1-phosphate uridylyltransferase